MRKIVMLLFVMMMFSVLAVPAFAQTGAGAAGSTNWVAITSGFAIAIASGLAAQGQGVRRRRRAKRSDAIRRPARASRWR